MTAPAPPAEPGAPGLRAERDELLAALMLLVADVAQYPAWERPCLALDRARAAIAAATQTEETTQ